MLAKDIVTRRYTQIETHSPKMCMYSHAYVGVYQACVDTKNDRQTDRHASSCLDAARWRKKNKRRSTKEREQHTTHRGVQKQCEGTRDEKKKKKKKKKNVKSAGSKRQTVNDILKRRIVFSKAKSTTTTRSKVNFVTTETRGHADIPHQRSRGSSKNCCHSLSASSNVAFQSNPPFSFSSLFSAFRHHHLALQNDTGAFVGYLLFSFSQFCRCSASEKLFCCLFSSFLFAILGGSDGNGYLTIEEFRTILQEAGVVVSENEVRSLLDRYDVSRDGKVSYSEVRKKGEKKKKKKRRKKKEEEKRRRKKEEKKKKRKKEEKKKNARREGEEKRRRKKEECERRGRNKGKEEGRKGGEQEKKRRWGEGGGRRRRR